MNRSQGTESAFRKRNGVPEEVARYIGANTHDNKKFKMRLRGSIILREPPRPRPRPRLDPPLVRLLLLYENESFYR